MGSFRIWFLGLSVAWALARVAGAAEPMAPNASQAEYSAQEVMETERFTMTASINVAPGKERKETDSKGTGQIQIIRQDKGVTWTLMPAQKMYMEMSLSHGSDSAGKGADLSGYKMETTEVGEEVIDGYKTKKSKLVMTDPKGNKFGGFIWTTSEGIQIKMDTIAMANGSKMRFKKELKDLKIGKQDPALFEIPAGYTQMSMPGLGGFNLQDMMKKH